MVEVYRLDFGENYSRDFMIFYQEYLPEDSLKHFIRCFWIYENQGGDWSEEVMTNDGSLNMIFTIKGHIVERGGRIGILPRNFVLPVSYPITFAYRDLKCVGINFRPWANQTLLKQSTKENLCTVLDITNLFGNERGDLIGKICTGFNSNEQTIALLQELCLALIKSKSPGDDLFRDVVNKIIDSNGELTIDDICDLLHLTKRGAELKFHKNVGTSPKYFLQKIRFHNFLKQAISRKGVDLTELAHSSGYYDQSHLIRTSRKFTGLPPSRLVPILSSSTSLNKKINFSL